MGKFSSSVVGVIWLALFFLFISIGPYCFAYDLNHLIPLLTHKPMNPPISMWSIPIFIGGVFLSETAIPVALIIWILVFLGVIA